MKASEVLKRYLSPYELEKFEKNLKIYSLDEIDKFSRDNPSGINLVSGAFHWLETPEGHKFWEDISIRVNSYQNAEKLESIKSDIRSLLDDGEFSQKLRTTILDIIG